MSDSEDLKEAIVEAERELVLSQNPSKIAELQFGLGVKHAQSLNEEEAFHYLRNLYEENRELFIEHKMAFIKNIGKRGDSSQYYLLSLIHKVESDEDTEREMFVKACELGLSFDFYRAGKKEKTRQVIDRSLEIKEVIMWSWTVLASLYEDVEDYVQAEQAYLKAIECGPPSVMTSEDMKSNHLVFDTDIPGDVVVHWGVCSGDSKTWQIPKTPHPPRSRVFRKKALQTSLQVCSCKPFPSLAVALETEYIFPCY